MWVKLKTVSSILFYLLMGTSLVTAAPRCYDTGNFTTNSTYGKNRDIILASLPSNVSEKGGFFSGTIGQNSDIVYALGMCRGDSTPDNCYSCVNSTIHDLIANCPNQKEAYSWAGVIPCLVRYADRSLSLIQNPETTASSSTIAEHLKLRRPTRNQTNMTEIDPNSVSEIPSLMQSIRAKPVISSFFLSTNNETTKKKANPFGQSTFRGLGCTASASQQVSVPALIRTSADWEANKVKKKKTQQQEREKKEKKKNKSSKLVGNGSNKVHHQQGVVLNEGSGYNISCGAIQDVWCGPGIGFSADAVGSVDRIVPRRNVPARGKIDVEKINHREPSSTARRTANPETLSFLDSDSAFISSRPNPDFFGARFYRHARHPSPEGLAEMMMLQRNLIMGAHDRFSGWRLDIDSMSYEQLLELGDKIGYVNTGLKEDEMGRCLRKMKGSIMENKCSICQEEYEADEETGKLWCGHGFHVQCIKQWLLHKNTCPVCKTEATARC